MASVRVEPREGLRLIHGGKALDPALKVAESGLAHLDRFDVIRPGTADRA